MEKRASAAMYSRLGVARLRDRSFPQTLSAFSSQQDSLEAEWAARLTTLHNVSGPSHTDFGDLFALDSPTPPPHPLAAPRASSPRSSPCISWAEAQSSADNPLPEALDPRLLVLSGEQSLQDANQLAQAAPPPLQDQSRQTNRTEPLQQAPGRQAQEAATAPMESDEFESEDGSFDAVPTIAPARLEKLTDDYADEELDDHEYALAVLEFPDTCYYIKEPSLVLGRDTKLQKWLDGNILDRMAAKQARQSATDSPNANLDDVDMEAGSSSPQVSVDGMPQTPMPQTSGGMSRDQSQLQHGFPMGEHKLPSGETFVPIHCPMDQQTGDIPSLGALSKMHLRLEMQEDEGWFLHVLGRNGVLLNDEFYEDGTVLMLEDGDKMMMSDLVIYFRCPEAQPPDADSAANEQSPTEQVGASHAAAVNGDSSKKRHAVDHLPDAQPPPKKNNLKLRLNLDKTKAVSKTGEPEDAPASAEPATSKEPQPSTSASVAADDADKRPAKPSRAKYPLDPTALLRAGEVMPQKRGPGRPPKNGVFSKREMKERLKAMEEAQRRELGEDAVKQLSMGKGDTSEKKTRRRRRSDGDDGDDKKGEKEDAAPRAPSPKREDYTAEQLEKPQATYAELLYPMLKELGSLSLQEIYKEFQTRWPYYKFIVQGNGWQSSIRHTVNTGTEKAEGHFIKDCKDGKGFKWAANPGNPVTQKPARVNNTLPPQQQQQASYQSTAGPSSQPYGNAPYGAPPHVQYANRSAFYPTTGTTYQLQQGLYRPQPLPGPGAANSNGQRPPNGVPPPTYPPAPYQTQASRPPGSVQAPSTQPNGGPPRPLSGQQGPGLGQHTRPMPQQQHAPGATQAGPAGLNMPPRPAASGGAPPPGPQPQQARPSPLAPPNPYQQSAARPSGAPYQSAAPPAGLGNANGIPRAGTATTLPGSRPSAGPTHQVNGHAGLPGRAALGPDATSTPTSSIASPVTAAGHSTPRPPSAQAGSAETLSGVEILQAGRYPAVIDKFRKAFVAEADDAREASEEEKKQQRAQREETMQRMVAWFMEHRSIDHDTTGLDTTLKNIIGLVKGLLQHEHRCILKRRSAAQQGSQPSTPSAHSPATAQPGATAVNMQPVVPQTSSGGFV